MNTDYTKLSEDLIDMATKEVNPEDVLEKKKALVNTIYNTDLNLDGADEDDVDKLIMNMPLEERIERVIEDMEILEGNERDMQEAIRAYTGMKLEEAAQVLQDKRING